MMVDIAAAAVQAQEEREEQEADDMSIPLDMLLELWVVLQGDPQSETTATVSDEFGGFPISDNGITAFMDHHESLVANPAPSAALGPHRQCRRTSPTWSRLSRGSDLTLKRC